MKAQDVMTMNVVTISPDHSVRHAAQIMLDNRISGIPVVAHDGRVMGIVTEGDFLRRAELGLRALSLADLEVGTSDRRSDAYVKSHSWKVADVMTADPVWVDEETPLSRIGALMEERGIKRVPVLREGQLVGIVSRADLLHALITAKLDETAPGDHSIRRSILTRLQEDTGVKRTNLTLTVTDGVVHLWGMVYSKSDRDAVRVAAEGVKGVKGVLDHLSLS